MDKNNVDAQLRKYATYREIQHQSKTWNETIAYFQNNKEALTSLMNGLDEKENLQVVITGAGSSAFVGNSVAAYLNHQTKHLVQSIPTTDLITNPELYIEKKRPLLLISCARSGNSPESIAAVDLTEKYVEDIQHILLTCNKDGQLAKKAGFCKKAYLLVLPDKTNDEGFAMTSSFTSMVLSTLLLFGLDDLEAIAMDMKTVGIINNDIKFSQMDSLLNLVDEPVDRAVFLGSNNLKGLAEEASLKLLELTNGQIMTNFDTPLGFRHGPKSLVKEKTMMVMFMSNHEETHKYEMDLLRELRNDNEENLIVAIGCDYKEEVALLASYYFDLKAYRNIDVQDMYAMFNYLTIIQLYSVMKSQSLGLDPDNPCPSGEVNRVVQGVIIH